MAEVPASRAQLAEKADILRRLHDGPHMLVLPNAWDAASARTFEAAGFPAIATSSNAIAASLGYEDHERAPAEEMLAAVARITAAVGVPVSADLEAGYRLAPNELVRRAIAAGAAGFNFEDTDHHGDNVMVPAEAQAEHIAALKQAARAAGVDLVLNARTDPLLHRTGSIDEQVADAVARAKLYRQAGADCIYPFGFYDEQITKRLVEAIDAPVNVVALQNPPPFARLAEIGVRRVTFASGLFRALMAALKDTTAALRAAYPSHDGAD